MNGHIMCITMSVSQDWLGNKRKQLSGIKLPKKDKVRVRQPSGRDLFMHDYMKGISHSILGDFVFLNLAWL